MGPGPTAALGKQRANYHKRLKDWPRDCCGPSRRPTAFWGMKMILICKSFKLINRLPGFQDVMWSTH